MLGQRRQSSVDPCELSVLEEQQDFHARPIVDVWILYRLVRSYQQGMKKHHHLDTCRQENQVFTGFFDGLEASATDHADHTYFNRTSAFLRPGGPPSGVLTIAYFISSSDNPANKLFLIYINDLPNVSNCLYFVLFADDTNVFFIPTSVLMRYSKL